ncbi:hypothetical protein [Arthrobacter sp. UYCo732]|uniref:hypothetical protein n=1 Tax=Arthrobacter sp. UYCo732 TaxID=3156336 RepID=UPI003395B315
MSLGRKVADLKSRRGMRYTLILAAVLLASGAVGMAAGVAMGVTTFAALAVAFLPKPEIFFGDTGVRPKRKGGKRPLGR